MENISFLDDILSELVNDKHRSGLMMILGYLAVKKLGPL
jgi:hypothetical protein